LKFPAAALADRDAAACIAPPATVAHLPPRRPAFVISRQITDETPAHLRDIDRQLAWVNLAAN